MTTQREPIAQRNTFVGDIRTVARRYSQSLSGARIHRTSISDFIFFFVVLSALLKHSWNDSQGLITVHSVAGSNCFRSYGNIKSKHAGDRYPDRILRPNARYTHTPSVATPWPDDRRHRVGLCFGNNCLTSRVCRRKKMKVWNGAAGLLVFVVLSMAWSLTFTGFRTQLLFEPVTRLQ